MEKTVSRSAKTYLNSRRRRGVWHKIVTVLAAVVVFCTTYALILPAVTLTNDLECGMEAHTHTDECWEVELVQPEAAEPICGLEESEGHTHTEECYVERRTLICGEKEIHTHNESCYTRVRGELICTEDHEHTDECYAWTQELTCGLEEYSGAPAHTHDESCYTKVRGELICTEEGTEEEPHEHTDECYAWTEELTCGLEENGAGHVVGRHAKRN